MPLNLPQPTHPNSPLQTKSFPPLASSTSSYPVPARKSRILHNTPAAAFPFPRNFLEKVSVIFPRNLYCTEAVGVAEDGAVGVGIVGETGENRLLLESKIFNSHFAAEIKFLL